MGFHDHPKEARRLQSARFQEDAAAGIVDALIAYHDHDGGDAAAVGGEPEAAP